MEAGRQFFASANSHLDFPRQKQTERVIRAMDNPRVSIFAHPRGRLIGQQEPYGAARVERNFA